VVMLCVAQLIKQLCHYSDQLGCKNYVFGFYTYTGSPKIH